MWPKKRETREIGFMDAESYLTLPSIYTAAALCSFGIAPEHVNKFYRDAHIGKYDAFGSLPAILSAYASWKKDEDSKNE